MEKLILASASPRRKEILAAAGFQFELLPTSIEEQKSPGESAEKFVCRMAREKAEAAWAALPQPCFLPVLGADTAVVLGEQVLGKPGSAEEARAMLRLLSGKEHQVLTGLCLLYSAEHHPLYPSEPCQDIRLGSTTVKFRGLTEAEIEQYTASGEPLDKAGAYAVQGLASRYVEWIRGCYFNVVGLPVSLLYEMLWKATARRDEHGHLPR